MKSWKLPLIILGSIVAIIAIIVFSVQGVQDKAFTLEEQVSSAESDIEIQEKRRIDLIPNLVDCIKAYDEHEYKTLMDVISARNFNNDAEINEVTTMIAATAEAYPELKSNEQYKSLMNELSITENMIAETRKNYNDQVKEYNRYVRKFKNRFCLNILGYENMEYEYLEYNAPSDAPKNLFE